MSITLDKLSFLAGYKAGAELRRLRKSGKSYTWASVDDAEPIDIDGDWVLYKIMDDAPTTEQIVGATIYYGKGSVNEASEVITADMIEIDEGVPAVYELVTPMMTRTFMFCTENGADLSGWAYDGWTLDKGVYIREEIWNAMQAQSMLTALVPVVIELP